MKNSKFDIPNKGNERFHYDNQWEVERGPGFQRVIIGAKDRHIDLILDIAKGFKPPYGILYVLAVPRGDKNKEGRYQCPYPVSYEELKDFCEEFKEYFESDGRHNLWICSASEEGSGELLAYDRHDIIYVYDNIEKIKNYLGNLGFNEGKVNIPMPHTHCYNKEYDEYEEKILNHWQWIHFPLEDGDE